jgi:hypothetical protein
MDTQTLDIASTELVPAPSSGDEAAPAEDTFKAQYPAVTQFKGRTIRYAPLESGQALALQSLDRGDDDKLTPGSMAVILAVLEGCIGPEQWQRLSLDLARKTIEAADVMQLFIKIMDKAKRDSEKAETA